jgi:alginate O-acetyltransferase complex protein AlgI
MVIFGLWHAATLPLLAWGSYQGFLLIIHRQVQNARKAMRLAVPSLLDTILSWAITFLAMSLGWILFRAHDLHQAQAMFHALIKPQSYLHPILRADFFIITAFTIAAYFAVALAKPFAIRTKLLTPGIRRGFWLLSPLYYAVALFFIIVWSRQETLFVYFQF